MTAAAPFQDALEAAKGRSLPSWAVTYRQQGQDWLKENALPTLRHEEWKYTSLRKVGEQSFLQRDKAGEVNEALLSSKLMTGAVPIVLVDGYLSQTHSRLADLPEGVDVKQIAECLESNEDYHTRLGLPDHPFSELNKALLGQGLMIHAKKGAVVEKPIQILHWQSAANGSAHVSCPRVFVVAEPSSQITVIETYAGEPGANLVATATGYYAKENADLRVCRAQLEHDDAYHFSMAQAYVARDARCEIFTFGKGARIARYDIEVTIGGEGGELALDGVYLAKGEQHTDLHSEIHHKVPNCKSSQLYKGVLDDKSRAVFNGRVFVHQDAQQTNAFQLNKNLLLSETAEIDTKPELQIDADDVKCSHGATVGQLNDDELFYLRSRAIPERQARTMLCKAYVGDALVKLKDDRVAAYLSSQVDAFFAGGVHV